MKSIVVGSVAGAFRSPLASASHRLDDALELPPLPGQPLEAVAISSDNRTALIAAVKQQGVVQLYSVSLAEPAKYHLWATLHNTARVFSVAWLPGTTDRIAFVSRSTVADTTDTALFTLRKGASPICQHFISRERNPIVPGGRAVFLAWVDESTFCFHRKGLRRIERFVAPKKETSQIFEMSEPAILVALRVAAKGDIEVIAVNSRDVVESPESSHPTLIRLDITGRLIEQRKLSPSGPPLGGFHLSDTAYVYGAYRPNLYPNIRVLERGTDRVLLDIPYPFDSVPPETLQPMALSPDGSRLVCLEVTMTSPAKRPEVRPLVFSVKR